LNIDAGMVVPHEADQERPAAESLYVVRHIRRPAEPDGFGVHLDNRDGGFRGDPVHRPPVIAVEHQVTDDGNPFSTEVAEQFPEAFFGQGGHSCSS
jgi:hypothetical protein